MATDNQFFPWLVGKFYFSCIICIAVFPATKNLPYLPQQRMLTAYLISLVPFLLTHRAMFQTSTLSKWPCLLGWACDTVCEQNHWVPSGRAPSKASSVSGQAAFLLVAWEGVTLSGGQAPSGTHANYSHTLMVATEREREGDPERGGAIIPAPDDPLPILQVWEKNQTSIWFSYFEFSIKRSRTKPIPIW